MDEKLRSIFDEYSDTADIGTDILKDGILGLLKTMVNIVDGFIAIVVMILFLPMWLIGKISKGKNDNA